MANREPIEETWMGDQTKYVCPECLVFDSLEKYKVDEHIRVKHPIITVPAYSPAASAPAITATESFSKTTRVKKG